MHRFLIALIVLAAASPGVAGQADSDAKAQQQQQMTPEQKAMMEAWEKAAEPGPEHQRLANMAGNWAFTMRYFPAPGAPPEESQGTASSEMIFGGRYLLDRASGEAMGMPFEGLGITGYDNVKGKYVSTWADSMGTGIMTSEGRWDEASNALVMEGQYLDPMTGKQKQVKTLYRMLPDGRMLFEFWEPGPDAAPFKTMEIEYRRR